MTPEFELLLQVILETLILFALIVGLLGLIVPIFPGLVIMWLATLVYAILQNAAGNMTGWKWFIFGIITLLMITGSIADNLIIARKMRDKYVPWSSILFAFAASLVASLFFTPLIGLVAAPVGLFLAESRRLNDREAAVDSTWRATTPSSSPTTRLTSWMRWRLRPCATTCNSPVCGPHCAAVRSARFRRSMPCPVRFSLPRLTAIRWPPTRPW